MCLNNFKQSKTFFLNRNHLFGDSDDEWRSFGEMHRSGVAMYIRASDAKIRCYSILFESFRGEIHQMQSLTEFNNTLYMRFVMVRLPSNRQQAYKQAWAAYHMLTCDKLFNALH